MITYTFLGDGSSDKALMDVINWVFEQKYPSTAINRHFADLRKFRQTLKNEERVKMALEYYPCDILFIHRDAEEIKNPELIYAKRKSEVASLAYKQTEHYVAVITIKMMETWLLTDETAIKQAAGNRNSKIKLDLPPITKLESEQNPKEKLHGFLKMASGLKGRRLESFNVGEALHRVAENTRDFTPLRNLYSFCKFEQDLEEAVNRLLANK